MTLSKIRIEELRLIGKYASKDTTQHFPEVYGFELEQLCKLALAAGEMGKILQTKYAAEYQVEKALLRYREAME